MSIRLEVFGFVLQLFEPNERVFKRQHFGETLTYNAEGEERARKRYPVAKDIRQT